MLPVQLLDSGAKRSAGVTVLTALAESMQERQALALRLGQVEAERAALQAALQSRRRWWRFWERD